MGRNINDNLITCPNCDCNMGRGEPCPECEHVDGKADCECSACASVECPACSRAGGADRPVYHAPPVCSDD